MNDRSTKSRDDSIFALNGSKFHGLEDLPKGRVMSRSVPAQLAEDYFLYLPTELKPSTRALVVVHGQNRNAAEYAFRFSQLAENLNLAIISPLLNEKLFPDYQRLGRRGHGQRADLAFMRMIDDASACVPSLKDGFHLFGYSGGAQFAHRFAMAYPKQIRSAVIAASGWYTFPETELAYPRGVRQPKKLKGVTFSPHEFLRVRQHLIVGDQDTARGAGLNRSKSLDRQQGRTRVERATRWMEAMNEAAESLGLTAPITMEIMHGAKHSFSRNVARHKLLERVFESL